MNELLTAPRKGVRPRWWASILRWFDTGVAEENLRPEEYYKVDWIRAIPFFAWHLSCLAVIWVGWSPAAVAVCAALYFVRMFAITAFYHRYFSHRTYKTSRAAQFVFAVLGASAMQKGPLWWAARHRQHHRHADQPEDIHSPREHGFLWAHFLWVTCRGSFNTDYDEIKDLAKYPELRWLDRYNLIAPALLAGAVYLLGEALERWAPGLGTSGPQLLVWGFLISSALVFHGAGLINSVAHLVGRRRYDITDDSRNSMALALLILGEGWHNNHHRYPAAARNGFFWWEVDITWYLLLALARLGVIWDLKPVPKSVLEGH